MGERLGCFEAHSPNLFWPTGHEWCVASEIDLDSALSVGAGALITAVLETPSLDAWRVAPDDLLACDADVIN